jgi:hypothetical protein
LLQCGWRIHHPSFDKLKTNGSVTILLDTLSTNGSVTMLREPKIRSW